MPIYPINFSIHDSKIVTKIPEKTRILAPLIPSYTNTYVYDSEDQYYQMYQESCFAITTKKAGWDCMRHYEILANACIPLFLDIDECPDSILTFLPKQLLIDVKEFYFRHINGKHKIEELSKNELDIIETYTHELWSYTRDKLTNMEMAKYVLGRSDLNRIPRNILFLSGCIHPDYLRCNILSGLKDIYKDQCHDFPKIPHIYTDYSTPELCYGKGFSYSRLFQEEEFRNNSRDSTIETDIKNHVYDVVIYGSYHRGTPYWELVNTYYDPASIIMLCGEDEHDCDYNVYSEQGYCMFVRELM